MKIQGKIVHGKGIGRTVGMPTANIKPSATCILPNEGVYATRIRIGEETFPSITNIGRRPSVDNSQEATIEAFIMDFDKNIYDEVVELELVAFIRPVQKFSCLKEVQEQVQKDIEIAREKLG